jgi:hypothetical protein
MFVLPFPEGVRALRVGRTAALADNHVLDDLTSGATELIQRRARSEQPYLTVRF